MKILMQHNYHCVALVEIIQPIGISNGKPIFKTRFPFDMFLDAT